ncbi:MAG TPA: retron system putative HNH endonuclease [Candidatus Dormibacteraeota bacterium]|jgi:uncharacterized protein (TIGR02646 family)
MIRIPRDRRDERGAPIRPGDEWYRLAAAWSATALAEQGEHESRRAVYHHDQVHAALERLCDRKCAYCEAPAPASTSWDVEHFRPKGRVSEREDHPGYYWLAYRWDNLLLSCELCNRRRKDRPTWERAEPGTTSGKVDRFPLADEATRAMTPDHDLLVEARLLIDPTVDDPEAHVTFDLDGHAVPREDSAMGAASIEVYHLNRRRLRSWRLVQIELVLDLVDRLTRDGRLSLGEALELVSASLARSALPWAGAVRAIVRDPAAFGLVE